jgi:hypothetical protein
MSPKRIVVWTTGMDDYFSRPDLHERVQVTFCCCGATRVSFHWRLHAPFVLNGVVHSICSRNVIFVLVVLRWTQAY